MLHGHRGGKIAARPWLAVALCYVFLLQTVLSLAMFTQHSLAATLSPDAGAAYCHASESVPAPPGQPEHSAAQPMVPCAFCAFAGASYAPPGEVTLASLKWAFHRLESLRIPETLGLSQARSTTRLAQGPPPAA